MRIETAKDKGAVFRMKRERLIGNEREETF